MFGAHARGQQLHGFHPAEAHTAGPAHSQDQALPRPSPKTRATQSILLLVTTCVLFCALSSSIYVYLALFSDSSWWLVTSAVLIAAGFPTISPFILMSSDPGISRLCVSAVEEITESPHLIREP